MSHNVKTLLLGVLLASVSVLEAQVTVGSIAGTARDPSGAVVPGVTVTLTSEALIGGARTQKTDETGFYKFLDLKPGEYSLKFEQQGFKTLSSSGIVITSGFQATVNVTLQVGQVSESVMVFGEAPLIDTSNVTNQAVLGQDLMERIPTARDPWALARLTPGVTPARFDVGGTEGMQQYALTVHGSRDSDKKFAIDGVEINWPGTTGGATAIYYDQGMFREVNYQTGALPAEVSQGGVYMNMVTKDGGNQIHGTGLFYYANDSMQADNVTPALKDALLFRLPASLRPSLRAGNAINEIYDVNMDVGGPFLKDKLWWFGSFRRWKVDQLASVGNALNPGNVQPIDDNLIWNLSGKGTWQINIKHRLSLLYDYNKKFRFHRRDTPPLFIDDAASVLQNQPGYSTNLNWAFTPTPKLVWTTGLALTHIVFPLRYQADVKPTDLSREDLTLSTRTGAPANNYVNPNYRAVLDSSGTYVTSGWGGSHSLKTGIMYSRSFFRQIYNANGDLDLFYSNGVPNSVRQLNTPLDQRNLMHQFAWFGQDTWTIRRRLTLNLGVRFEYVLGVIPHEKSAAGTYFAARDVAEIRDVPNFKNVVPRIGLSWDVTGRGRTVIKASASKYLQNIGMGLITNFNPFQIGFTTYRWNDLNGDNLPQLNELTLTAGFNGGLTNRIDRNLERPYSWEYSLGVQQEVIRGLVVSATGWHRDTRRQIGRANQLVPPSVYLPTTVTNPLTNQPITVYNQDRSTVGRVDNLFANFRDLDSAYNGIDLIFMKRFAHRWQLLGGWTISKEYGAFRGDTISGLDDLNNPSFTLNRRGIVGTDATHAFKLAGTFRLPWSFEFSGNFNHFTGYPLRRIFIASLNQGNQNVDVLPRGNVRLKPLNLMDVRFSRIFKLHENWSFQPTLDLYNLANVNTTIQEVETLGSALGRPGLIVAPRLLKLGIKVDF